MLPLLVLIGTARVGVATQTGSEWLDLGFRALYVTLVVAVMMRVGVLSVFVFMVSDRTAGERQPVPELSRWYATPGMLTFATLAGLAVFGAWAAGQRETREFALPPGQRLPSSTS